MLSGYQLTVIHLAFTRAIGGPFALGTTLDFLVLQLFQATSTKDARAFLIKSFFSRIVYSNISPEL